MRMSKHTLEHAVHALQGGPRVQESITTLLPTSHSFVIYGYVVYSSKISMAAH